MNRILLFCGFILADLLISWFAFWIRPSQWFIINDMITLGIIAPLMGYWLMKHELKK